MPALDSFGPRHALIAWSVLLWPPALGFTWTLTLIYTELSMQLALAVAALVLGALLLLSALWLHRRRSAEEEQSAVKVLLFWATCSASIGVLGLCL